MSVITSGSSHLSVPEQEREREREREETNGNCNKVSLHRQCCPPVTGIKFLATNVSNGGS
jgi:hypothetical protein